MICFNDIQKWEIYGFLALAAISLLYSNVYEES